MKVKCIWPGTDGLTYGDIYHVRGQGTDNQLRIENDDGDVRYYPAGWFDLI